MQFDKRNVDQPILAGQRHGRLGAILGERIEPRTSSAAEDEGEDVLHDLPFIGEHRLMRMTNDESENDETFPNDEFRMTIVHRSSFMSPQRHSSFARCHSSFPAETPAITGRRS